MNNRILFMVRGTILSLALIQSTSAVVTPWSQVGPTTGTRESTGVYRSGEVSDIDASVPGRPIGIATVWGGYFVGGLPRSDTIPTGAMRSIARCPTNPEIAVLATGSSPSLGGEDAGLGVFYTANDGRNWQLALPAQGNGSGAWRIEKVRWGASSIVFAATNRGLYRSTNYGMPGSWSVVRGNTSATLPFSSYDPDMDVLDIAVDPASPSTVYILTPGGLLRSDNNGSTGTWTRLAWPPTRFDRSRFDPTRIRRGSRLAIPRQNPGNVYLMAADSAGLYGFFHTTNFGVGRWIADDPGTCAVRPDAIMSALAASPTDSNILLAGGGSGAQMCRSSNGGLRWDPIGPGARAVHADHRAIAFGPDGTAHIGGDGGIFSSNDGGVTWNSAGNLLLNAPNVLSFDVSAANPAYLYLANWDNGLWANNGGSFWVSTQQDTTDIEADPTNQLRAWASIGSGGGDRYATVDGGLNFDPFNGNLPSSSSAALVRTNGGSSLFTSSGRAVYTTNMPATLRPSTGIPAPRWTKWPNARTPDFAGTVEGLTVNRPGRGVLLCIYAWTGLNPDQTVPREKLYVFDSRTFAWRLSGRRTDGTEYFTTERAIRHVATSASGQLAYVVFWDDSIYASADHGTTWENISATAPPGVWDVLIDPADNSRVFVATRGGVFQSITPRVWRNWSLGLPFVNGTGAHVVQMRTATSAGTTYLYAAVQGRGVFRRDITSDP